MSNKANSIIDKSQQELLSRIKDIEKMLLSKREITNLQRYLSSSLNATDLPFSDIETKVAPKLFLAFLERLQLSDTGLFAISKCSKLEILHLVKTPECTNDGLKEIAEKCKILRKHHIDG